MRSSRPKSRSKTKSKTRSSQIRINQNKHEPNRMMLCEKNSEVNNQPFCISSDMKYIHFKGVKYIKNETILSRGGYGMVYSYHNNDTNHKLVMKKFMVPHEYKHEEVKSRILYEKLMDGKIKNTISSYYNEDNSVIIMPMKDGDLNDKDTISTLSVETKNQIYKNVVLTMINMLKNDLFYCDLKPGNILFSKQNDNTPLIYLADIGGIIFDPIKYETPNYPEYFQDVVFTYSYRMEFIDNIDSSNSIYLNHDFLSNYIQQIVSFYFIFVLNMDKRKFFWTTPFGRKYTIQPNKLESLLYRIQECYQDNEENNNKNNDECKQMLIDFLEKLLNIHENIDEWKSEFMVDHEQRRGRKKSNKKNKHKKRKETRKQKKDMKRTRQLDNDYWLWSNKDKLRKKSKQMRRKKHKSRSMKLIQK